MPGAEMAFRVRQTGNVHAFQMVIFIVDQAAVTDQRPKHQAEHALVVPIFCRRPVREIAAHELDDIDATICAPGPHATNHQFVVQYVIANHVKWVSAVNPLLNNIGLRRR